jgi:hypothetical protein
VDFAGTSVLAVAFVVGVVVVVLGRFKGSVFAAEEPGESEVGRFRDRTAAVYFIVPDVPAAVALFAIMLVAGLAFKGCGV